MRLKGNITPHVEGYVISHSSLLCIVGTDADAHVESDVIESFTRTKISAELVGTFSADNCDRHGFGSGVRT